MEKFTTLITGFLFLLIISPACKKATVDPGPALVSQDYLNVSYGANIRNTFDIYLPEKRDVKTPVVLLIHGGSWFEGDKSAFTDLAKYWREKGFAAVTMNYRFTNTPEKNIHPAQVNDIAKAIDFIASKSTEWKVSGDKFALQGASAGGHLALLYTYKYDAANKVKSVISMAGPTDLTVIGSAGPAQAQVAQWLLGSTIQANPAAYVEASPITHVNAGSKPTLLFHGKLDVVVPFQQSQDLKNRLTQLGAVNKLVLYEDTGHEVVNVNHMASFLAECESWLRLHLK
ncbi:alpha/beta fold hydrolase [Daejeonella lutea]|uniref:Prolyl oligopeptidase family protein n=1 Tax=Daejeonella lutea TaxID=572036 RepID=A0A1T5FE30_9SPHI|nr:alpha/beta fold hydrolase [Daejeonella lutea]SKB94392.1 Prolyl oligopeptidase family protein [Daejeonella lutea]